ncbi:MAG: S8 family serine peptidase [Thermotogae bacterium]|nr:S8 family serine peptidase [Thermotogota bacterium]
MTFIIALFRPPIGSVPGWDRIEEIRLKISGKKHATPSLKVWYLSRYDSKEYWSSWDGKRIVVRLKEGISPSEVLGDLTYRKAKFSDSWVVELPESKRSVASAKELLSSLNLDVRVVYAEPMLIYRTTFWPNDPLFGAHLWGMWAIYADKAWDIIRGNSSVKVCVVDEGMDYNHEDLSGNYAGGYDMVDLDSDPYPADASEMHGTHVAGTIGAVLNNGVGVAGVSQVGILSCRALAGGSGTSEDIAACVRWCATNGAKVINMSLGSSSPSSEIQSALRFATDSVSGGVLIVAASGNDGMNGVYYPAAFPEALAVGAIDTLGQRASFSNYGVELELVAPGSMIASTVPFTDAYAYADGTSMATPHVSGVAALIFSRNPNLSADTVRAILDATAIDMGEYGKDYFYGYGLVNAYLALLATPTPTATPQITKGLKVSLSGRKLEIFAERSISLFSADGRLVARGTSVNVSLPPGAYFLKYEGGIYRFLVR